MSKKILLVFLLAFIFSIPVCAQQYFVANLTGRQQVPPNASSSYGGCYAWVENNATRLRLDCFYKNLSVNRTGYTIGAGSIGTNGSEIFVDDFPATPNGRNGGFEMTYTGFTAQNLSDLLANRLYIVIKSEGFPNGEIRGQLHIANGTYNDFDGDGRTDLTVYRNSNNTFYAQSSLTGALIIQPLGQPGDSVSLTLDFDGDGRSDFSTARYSSNIVWRFIRSNDGYPYENILGSSSLGDFFAAANYEGVGAQVAVFRAGVWYILQNPSGDVRYEYFGQAGDVPAPNDYDADGKADLAVARSENGQRVWHVRRSSDGVYYSVQWGLSSDAFFTGRADWDGDGAADITVIRNQSGQRVFYILRSSDRQMQVIYWGLSSDVVKLGDYDGDNKTDAAVTRAVNGQRVFYILQSSTGEPRYETFGLAGDF